MKDLLAQDTYMYACATVPSNRKDLLPYAKKQTVAGEKKCLLREAIFY